MRYDTLVQFITEDGAMYDPDIGGRAKVSQVQGEKHCLIYDMSKAERLETFGRIDVRAIVLHHLGKAIPANKLVVTSGDFIGKYNIISVRSLRNKTSIVAQEIV